MLFSLPLQGPSQPSRLTHVFGCLTAVSSDVTLILNYILRMSLLEVCCYLRCASLSLAVSQLYALYIQLSVGQSAPFMELMKGQADRMSAIFLLERKIWL